MIKDLLEVIISAIVGLSAISSGEILAGSILIVISLVIVFIEEDSRKNLLNLMVSFAKPILEKLSKKSNNAGSQVMDNSDSSIQNSVTGANVSNVGGDVIQNINIVNENQKNIK